MSDRCQLNFWDIGGQKSIRPFWRNYYEETDAIVWVIDSADASRLDDCRRELESVLTADVSTNFSEKIIFYILSVEINRCLGVDISQQGRLFGCLGFGHNQGCPRIDTSRCHQSSLVSFRYKCSDWRQHC